eukprot:3310849-Pyramimonas_sp.AAC.1
MHSFFLVPVRTGFNLDKMLRCASQICGLGAHNVERHSPPHRAAFGNRRERAPASLLSGCPPLIQPHEWGRPSSDATTVR